MPGRRMWFTDADRRETFRPRRRHDRADPERRFPRRATPSAAIRCGILIGGFLDSKSKAPSCAKAYNCVSCLNTPPHDVGVDQLVLGRLHRCLHPPLRDGHLARFQSFSILTSNRNFPVATNYETHEYDVLVIGAGGAGLRAAIEASAAGVKVGLICKSLLGKAHTVMAEGGMAAAMGNVDDRDSWKVHFADTMRGGQYVNNWRMAELHAKEAPVARPRTGSVGRGVRPHEGRKDFAAQFRRPSLSAPRARRRPHGPGDDPHVAGPRHSSGHHGSHGIHDRHAAQGRRPRRRRVWLRSRARPFQDFQGEGRRRLHRRPGPRLQSHEQFLGRHRRRRIRSRITRARNCWTWNSSSFIRPA